MRKSAIFIVLTSFLLQACVAAAVLTGVTVGGLIIYDKRSLNVMAIDNRISHDIKGAIKQERTLDKQTHVIVSTFNQIVLLAGQAPTAAQREQIVQIASNTENVKRIYNEITVSQPTTKMTRASDMLLSKKVRTGLLSKSGLRSAQIKTVTENGVVYLMGIVNREQGDLATEATRRIDGVQKVVTLFEYSNI